jgi:predicted RNA polymerase sigma factor
MPDEPEVLGLLALMLLTDARRAARTAPDGSLVPLDEQDRRGWDRDRMTEGQDLVWRCLRIDRPGPYQLQAATAPSSPISSGPRSSTVVGLPRSASAIHGSWRSLRRW